MSEKYTKRLYLLSFLYLYIPVCIFLIGWLHSFISIPLVLASAYCLYKYLSDLNIDTNINIWKDKKKIFISLGILFVWVWLSGVGGFSWQNDWDHMFRNAIFLDLVDKDWPVVESIEGSPHTLCYYIGYWLPSALLAKISNSLMVGFIFQFIWGFWGVSLAFFLISQWIGKTSYKTLVIFILFSGLDIISYIYITGRRNIFYVFEEISHLELNLFYYNSSSNSTLLFWLYNQAIPFWVGFMLILLQRNNKYLLLIYSLLILFCPMAVIALAPAMLYIWFKNTGIQLDEIRKSLWNYLRNEIITIQNFTGVCILMIIILYFSSNASSNKMVIIPIDTITISRFLIFIAVEYAVYIFFVYKRIKRNYFFMIMMATMLLFSFVKIGDSYDFAWRTCIPITFYLMLFVIKELVDYSKSKTQNIKHILLYGVLIIGSLTPILEIYRTVFVTTTFNGPFRSCALDSIFLPNPCQGNFVGSTDSFFYNYLVKKKNTQEKNLDIQ